MLLFGSQFVSGQGYTVEYNNGGGWKLVEQAAPESKVAVPFTAGPGTPQVIDFRIHNISGNEKSFNGALLGLFGDEGDFSTSNITPQVPFSLLPDKFKEFTISYDPTCPSDVQPVNIIGTGSTDSFPFNVSGTALDSEALIGSRPDSASRFITNIPNGSVATVERRNDFGDVAVGGGNVPDADKLVEFTLSNFTAVGAPQIGVRYGDAEITGPHAGDFSISGLSSTGIVAAGTGSVRGFQITFNPSAFGERTATFRVKLSDDVAGSDGVFTFALRGNGVGTRAFVIEGSADTSPQVFDEITHGDNTPKVADGTKFPLLDPGQGAMTFIRISNEGDVPLGGTIEATLISGPDVIALDKVVNIDPGTSQIYELKYVPGDARTTRALVTYQASASSRDRYFFEVEGTAAGPEIQLIGGDTPIQSISPNTPSPETGTIFSAPVGGSVTLPFTLRNIGNQDMNITQAFIQGGDGPFTYSGIDGSNFTLVPNATREFTVTYSPQDAGDEVDKVFQITSDDANESAFTFTLRGTPIGQPVMRVRGVYNWSILQSFLFPQIRVGIDETPLVPDQHIINYGSYGAQSAPFGRRIQVVNDGTSDLNLTAIPSSSNPRWTIEDLNSMTAPAGGSLTFRVVYTPDVPDGSEDNTVVTILSNDSVTPVYQFALTASTYIPGIEVFGGSSLDQSITDGGEEFSETNGTRFPITQPGEIDTRAFRLKNIGTETLSLIGFQSDSPDDDERHFSFGPPVDYVLEPGEDTLFTINFQPAEPGEFSTTVKIAAEDGVGFTFDVTGIGADPNATPVMQVQSMTPRSPILSNFAIASVLNGTDFGEPVAGAPVTSQFLITNLSNQRTLNLQQPTLAPSGNGFSATIADLSVLPGESTTMSLVFDPGVGLPGTKIGSLRIDSDAGNANPFFGMFYKAVTPGGVSGGAEITAVLIRPNGDPAVEYMISGGTWNLTRSDDLAGPWTVVKFNQTSGNLFIDESASGVTRRFYRLEEQ